jgi:hypothetical protein
MDHDPWPPVTEGPYDLKETDKIWTQEYGVTIDQEFTTACTSEPPFW